MANAESVTLTPTARLARSAARQIVDQHLIAQQTAWLKPKILPIPVWISALRDDYFLDADDARTPITADQAREIWKSVIDTDVFIGEPRVAELAERAWRLIHEQDLQDPLQWPRLLLNTDSAQFRRWSAAFLDHCKNRGVVDEWRWARDCPDLIARGLIEAPGTIIMVGFDLPPTPLQTRILDACAVAGTRIEWAPADRTGPSSPPAPTRIVQTIGDEQEMLAAARWARQRLEHKPDSSLAVIVTNLEARTNEAELAFRRIFDPAGLALAPAAAQAWHISLGKPLRRWPLVADALLVLGLDMDRFEQPDVHRLLRSPFIEGGQLRAPDRADLIVRLARHCPHAMTGHELIGQFNRDQHGDLVSSFKAWLETRRKCERLNWPSAWVGQFQVELSAFGFGRGRPLDSQEFQVLSRWQELLESIAALDAVVEQPIGRGQALRLLGERAGVVFRERNPGVPVEILGMNEALGSRFDAIWLAGMDAESWPPPVRREPLVPGPIQAAVAGADSVSNLELARQKLELLLACADEFVASYAIGDADEPRALTPLLTGPTEAAVPEPGPAPAPLARLQEDDRALALASSDFTGGTGLLQKQSDCPFSAFAVGRLEARELPTSRPGLTAGHRGTLVHKALEEFWSNLSSQTDLLAMDQHSLEQAIDAAIEQSLKAMETQWRLLLTESGRQLEHTRLQRRLTDWLALEKTRAPFHVVGREQPVEIRLAGLSLRGKIDRIDAFTDGGDILIDYKTGSSARVAHWAPVPRMRNVQLPAYALAMAESPAAVAFGHIRPDGVRLLGLAEVDIGTDGVAVIGQPGLRGELGEIESWKSLIKGWRISLEGLAADFLAGQATVDPHDPGVCKRCHLHALCRIHERMDLMGDEE